MESKIGGKNSSKRHKAAIDVKKCRGVLVTSSSPNFEAKAALEALTLLDVSPVNDGGIPAGASNVEDEAGYVNIAAQLRDEVQDQKEASTKRFRCHRQFGQKGVSFISFNRNEDIPSEIVERVFHDVLSGASKVRCRFLRRIVPLDAMCLPYAGDLRLALAPIIGKHMPRSLAALRPSEDDSQKPSEASTWAVELNRRNMKTMERQDVFKICGELVGPENVTGYKVDLKDPDQTIVIEVNPLFCGFSVCKGFNEKLGFNLHRILYPEDATAKPQVAKSLDRNVQVETKPEIPTEKLPTEQSSEHRSPTTGEDLEKTTNASCKPVSKGSDYTGSHD